MGKNITRRRALQLTTLAAVGTAIGTAQRKKNDIVRLLDMLAGPTFAYGWAPSSFTRLTTGLAAIAPTTISLKPLKLARLDMDASNFGGYTMLAEYDGSSVSVIRFAIELTSDLDLSSKTQEKFEDLPTMTLVYRNAATDSDGSDLDVYITTTPNIYIRRYRGNATTSTLPKKTHYPVFFDVNTSLSAADSRFASPATISNVSGEPWKKVTYPEEYNFPSHVLGYVVAVKTYMTMSFKRAGTNTTAKGVFPFGLRDVDRPDISVPAESKYDPNVANYMESIKFSSTPTNSKIYIPSEGTELTILDNEFITPTSEDANQYGGAFSAKFTDNVKFWWKGVHAQTILLTRLYDSYDIVVQKVLSGTSTTQAFDIEVSFSGTGAPANQTLTLKGGEKANIANIPTGVTYKVTETNPDSALFTVSYTNQTGTPTESDTTVNVKVTNTRRTGKLKVTKALGGTVKDTQRQFQIDVSFQGTDAPATRTLTLKGGESQEITVPAGCTYTVTEKTTSSTGHDVTYAYSNSQKKITANTTDTVTVTNTRQTGTLKVDNKIAGTVQNPNQAFSFKVEFSGTDASLIPGVTKNASNNYEIAFTLTGNATKTISNIPAGVTYTITETENARYIHDRTSARGEIAANATSTEPFVNTLRLGSVSVTKTLNNKNSLQELDTPWTVYVTLSGYEATSGIIQANRTITLQVPATSTSVSQTIPNIPVGISYTVSEKTYQNYDCTIQNATGTITENTEAKIVVTNTRKTGFVTTRKNMSA